MIELIKTILRALVARWQYRAVSYNAEEYRKSKRRLERLIDEQHKARLEGTVDGNAFADSLLDDIEREKEHLEHLSASDNDSSARNRGAN